MNEPSGQYYGGGPLTKSIGDYLSTEKVQLVCLYARCAVTWLAKSISGLTDGSSISSELSVVSAIPSTCLPDRFPYTHPYLGGRASVHADWEYFTLAPYIKPHLISDGSGAYELIVTVSFITVVRHRTPDHVLLSLTRGILPAVLNTCAAGEYSYASHDLLVPHPTLEGYWKFYGRADDQIVHSTGEKVTLNPGIKFVS
jgi:hypothetical protein